MIKVCILHRVYQPPRRLLWAITARGYEARLRWWYSCTPEELVLGGRGRYEAGLTMGHILVGHRLHGVDTYFRLCDLDGFNTMRHAHAGESFEDVLEYLQSVRMRRRLLAGEEDPRTSGQIWNAYKEAFLS